jgi:phage-related protein
VIAGLSVAVLAVNTAFKVYAATTKVVTAVTWLMNTALLSSPLTWVVIGVVALVAAFVLLIKNSEGVRRAITNLWNSIKSGAKSVADACKSAFDAVLGAVKSTFNWIKANWPLLLAILTGPFGIAVAVIVKHWDTIKAATIKLVDAIKAKFAPLAAVLTAPFDAMKRALDAVIGTVEKLIGWLGKIKVPKISLPKIPGINSTAAPAPSLVGAPRGATRAVSSSSAGGINITVNGALDPEAVARQIRRILAGHDYRVGAT